MAKGADRLHHRHDHLHHAPPQTGAATADQVRDPVCGMTVDPKTAKFRLDLDGTPYYFCSAGCRDKFKADPQKYLGGPAAPAEQRPALGALPEGAQTEVLWTCPMHPKIVRNAPGSCPICGMALEPMSPVAQDQVNPELKDMSRRFWASVVLVIPLVLLAMAPHLPGLELHGMLPVTRQRRIELLLATPVVLWGGWPFFARGWASVVNRRLNMFSLIALGTGVAYLYSVVATIVPGIFPPSFRSPEGDVAVYFEAAAVIVALVLLGQVLELRARAQTGGAIRALLDLAPKTARLVNGDGREEDIPLERVAEGDRLRVRPGEKVPVDGVVIDGRSAVDESMSPASRSPSKRDQATRSPAPRSTPLEHSPSVQNVSEAEPFLRRSSAWSPRRSARALPSKASPTACPPYSFQVLS
jgi:Cu+-exporting ATPase